MGFDIVQITQKISVVAPGISPGWPAFAAWISTQVAKRTITGYHDYNYNMVGWSDQWGGGGDTSYKKQIKYQGAVLSTEVVGLLEAPPLSLPNKEAIALREHLVEIGLLVAHCFYKSSPCNSLIQFRL